jgi:hypothetical protein
MAPNNKRRKAENAVPSRRNIQIPTEYPATDRESLQAQASGGNGNERNIRPEPGFDERLLARIRQGAGSWFQNKGSSGYLIHQDRVRSFVTLFEGLPENWHCSGSSCVTWLTESQQWGSGGSEYIPAQQIIAALRDAQDSLNSDVNLAEILCVDAFKDDPTIWYINHKYEIDRKFPYALLRLLGRDPLQISGLTHPVEATQSLLESAHVSGFGFSDNDIEFLQNVGPHPDPVADEAKTFDRKAELLFTQLQRVMMRYRKSGGQMLQLQHALEKLENEAERYGRDNK